MTQIPNKINRPKPKPKYDKLGDDSKRVAPKSPKRPKPLP